MSLNTAENQTFDVVSKRKYHEQAQFFLNAFWNEFGAQAEEVWGFWTKIKDLDKQQFTALVAAGKASGDYVEGCSLDEFWSHKFLENIGKTMSIVEFRTEFKKIDTNTDKRMGMVEFLLYQYKQTAQELLSRPQGGDPEELAKAQRLLEEVSAAFESAQKALNQASVTEQQAKQAKEAAIQKEAASNTQAAQAKQTADAASVAKDQSDKTAAAAKVAKDAAEETAKAAAAAAAEQQQAVDALKQEEDAYNNRTKELQALSDAGGVSGMKAKNELAQHLAKDPLPLSRAKITAEAAKKKTDKAKAAADAAAAAATEAKNKADADLAAATAASAKADHDAELAKQALAAATAARQASEAAAAQAEEDRIAAEESVKAAEAKVAEAEAYLNEVKSKSDKTYGTFWWLDRELAERKKYMPKSGKAKLLF